MEDAKLTMPGLLRNIDIMADVLCFLTRRELALQLAGVNRRFSALCNCWCQEQEDEKKAGEDDAEAASVDDASAAVVPAPSAYENAQQRKRKWDHGSKCMN